MAKIPLRTVKPENIWANYDHISDSLLIYFTGKPVPSSVEWLDNHMGILLDDNDTVVGFQIDHVKRAQQNVHQHSGRTEALQLVTVYSPRTAR